MPTSRYCLLLLGFLGLLLIVACGSDDDGGDPVTPTPTVPMPDALEGYWQAQDDISGSLTQMSQTWDDIEAAFAGKATTAEIDVLVERFVAESEAAAAHYDHLIELENAIVPYGEDKGMFTNAVKSVVVGVYNASKKVVVSTGQGLRTGWRVLSGQKSLREALMAPDSGIPILSDYAKRLKEHNEQRDDAIVQAITDGDDHGGLVSTDGLSGTTPAEKAAAYRNLSDDDPLKKELRGGVHFWHTEEKAATVTTLKKAAQDQVKNYVGAISGSDELVEIGDQMTNPEQAPTDKGTLSTTVRDADSAASIDASKIMIIRKRDQPEHEEKIAVAQGVDAGFDMELPSGTYDVIIMAEDYIRAAATEVRITAGGAWDTLLEMHDRVTNSLVLESIAVDPEIGAVGEPVTLQAFAASTIDQTLAFAWSVAGPVETTISGTGPSASFTPESAGDYTVTLTVSDGLGNSKQKTASVTVLGGTIEVTSVTMADGAIADGELNPGEQVVVTLTMSNRGDEAVTGTATLQNEDGVTIVSAASQAVSLDVGESATWPVTIQLPVDYCRDEVTLVWQCTTSGPIIEQDVILPVEFWVEIAPIASPVTDRVLTVTGTVANPLLTSAHLIIDDESDQVFEVALTDGAFSQEVVLEGAAGQRTVSIALVADSGSWRAEDVATFTADVTAAGLRVTLTWDTAGTDVDLWVTDPNGERCSWENDYTASGLVLDVDDVDGYGPENITNQAPPAGNYLVQVHYWDDNADEDPNPSSCTVTIRLNEGTPEEQVLGYSGYLSETDDVWTVATVAVGAGKSGARVQEAGRIEPYEGDRPHK